MHLEPAYFQELLLAFIARDDDLVARFVKYYDPDAGCGPPASEYLGKAIKCLALEDVDGAAAALSRKRPKFERQSMGYADCLEAIVQQDVPTFVAAIDVAAEHWRKWASRTMKGRPPAVCFIHGAGIIRLAEHVLGTSIEIENPHIPPELLRAS